MAQNLELSKTRDFGETITDTFVFARQNLKPLLICFFTFCGFFLIAGAVLSSLEQAKAMNLINDLESDARLYRTAPFSSLGIEYFFSVLFIILNYITMQVTIFSFIAIYKEKGNIAATPQEVWGYVKYFFLKILGSGLLIVILLVIATMLCFFPGVYLYPVFALIFPIMIFENSTFGYAFNRSFKLIKDNWWITFGTLIVIGLIVYFAAMAIMLPLTIANFSSFFIHPRGGLHLSPTITIITAILQHFCQVFYIVPLITVSLIYFNLVERLDSTGLMGRISQLGTTGPGNSASTEEY